MRHTNRMKRLLPLLLLLALPATAQAKPAYCSAKAIQEIRVASGKPKLAGINSVVCGDVTDDGVKDAIYTVLSGGTAGPIRFGVIRGGSEVTISFERTGYKVTVDRVNDHRFDVQQPFYAADDPNCCPTAFDVIPFRWDGGTFKRGRSTRFKHFQKRFH